VSTLAIGPNLYRSLPYDPVRDFVPITHITSMSSVLLVHPSVPARSLKELVDLARARPGLLTLGTPGVGGLQHLTVEMLNTLARVKLQNVPYKGTGPAMTDVLGGHIDGVVGGIAGLVVPAKSGKLRVLAITGEQRSSALPDVATAVEQGLPGFVVVNWYSIVAPPNMPSSMANRLHAAIVKVVASPAVSDKFVAAGIDPKTDASPAVFAQFVREEFTRWGRIVNESGVKVE
jgi:tripartite-type tricarboxylate transporter receptor subunit TctC